MRLIEYQLRNTLTNLEQIRKVIDFKRKTINDDNLETWHYELLDMELRVKDMLRNIDKLKDHFQRKCDMGDEE